MVEIDAAELKQLQKENRVLAKKLKRAQTDLTSLEQAKRNRETLHRKVILELQDSQAILKAQKQDLEHLLKDLRNTQNKLLEAEKTVRFGSVSRRCRP